MKNISKKYYAVMFLLVLMLFSVGSMAQADDDDEDDDHEEDDDRRTEVIVNTSDDDSESSKPKMVTKTIIVQPEKIVTSTIMQNVQVPDSDRDGLADEADPHPDIAEQLIVQDSNFDGIDDRYQLQITQ